MAAAFLLDAGRSRGRSSEFIREVEEEGIKFSMENAAEDIINGMFCTYEPPTSKHEQYNAAKAARTDPKKYAYRPHVPKSILKWKFKKNKKSATPSENAEASFAAIAKAAAAAAAAAVAATDAASGNDAARNDDANDGVVVFDKEGNKKSVTWKDEKSRGDRTEIENTVVGLASKYCGGACNQGEEIAEILSSPTGRATQTFFTGGPETPGSMASMAASILKTSKSPTTSGDSDKKTLYDDEGNPVREDDAQEDEIGSFFPSTPKEDTAAATPMAATDSAAAANSADPNFRGHQNLFCSNIPFVDTVKEGIGIAGVMAATAAVAAGVPENLCNPYKMKRTNKYSTPGQMQISEELKEAQKSLGVYEPDSYDQAPDVSAALKLKRQSTPKHAVGRNNMSSQQSYAHSDVTMGNTTINHFSGNVSLFDETVNESTASSFAKSPNSKRSFSSMVEELKHVQLNKNLDGSSQHGSEFDVGSIKKGYEKIAKSPKHSVVTNSYKNSLKSPSTPKSNKIDLFEVRSGTVASLAKQFESPKARTNQNAIRKSIDPTECRHFNGKLNLLPPTPRRKAPSTPSGYSMVGNKFETLDWNNNAKTRQDSSAVSVNTDAEIREAASTILDDGPSKKASKRPIFAGRRPRSLVAGPETVENEDHDENAPEERQDHATTNKAKKKEKKAKMKGSKSKDGFANKFKKVVRKATRNVESQRIAKSEY
jgi:hypothetical protein